MIINNWKRTSYTFFQVSFSILYVVFHFCCDVGLSFFLFRSSFLDFIKGIMFAGIIGYWSFCFNKCVILKRLVYDLIDCLMS